MYQTILNPFTGQSDGVLRLTDMASIPQDPNNRDYAAYLAWVGIGGIPQPPPDPPTAQAAAPTAG